MVRRIEVQPLILQKPGITHERILFFAAAGIVIPPISSSLRKLKRLADFQIRKLPINDGQRACDPLIRSVNRRILQQPVEADPVAADF